MSIRETNKARLLSALQANPKGLDTQELVKIAGSRFGGRVHEARKDGYLILTLPIEGTENALYVLRGKREIQPELSLKTGRIEKYIGKISEDIELFEAVNAS